MRMMIEAEVLIKEALLLPREQLEHVAKALEYELFTISMEEHEYVVPN